MSASLYARLQNAAAATGNGSELNVNGLSEAIFQISGTFVGTVTFEGSTDGTNFTALTVTPVYGGANVTTATAQGIWRASIAGLQKIRVRVSAYTSGAITVDAFASEGRRAELDPGRRSVVVQAQTLTRPADVTAYAVGDLVANSTTAGSVVALVFSTAINPDETVYGVIRRVRLRKSTNVVTNAAFRLHLYAAAPTPANGDNGAWSTNRAPLYLGHIDVTIDKAFTEPAAVGIGVVAAGAEIDFSLARGQVFWGLLEARGAYTPGNAEQFTAALEIDQF